MGWQSRSRGSRYYYKAARIDGEPRQVYCGAGGFGTIHELLDRRERRAKEAARAALLAETAQQAEMDKWWPPLWEWTRVIAAAALHAAGWYNHHGEWRGQVGQPRTRDRTPSGTDPGAAVDVMARVRSLNARANAGDDFARAELGRLLDEYPEVWQTVGDLTQLSAVHWAALVSGSDALAGESITRFVEKWTGELAGPDSTPVEKALAGVARLALTHAEFGSADAGVPVAVAKFRSQRLDAALHRLAQALRLLAQVQAARAGRPRLFPPPGRKTKAG